ncbi:MAG TPA: hypothetical protein VK891_11810, partial [Euzebyales bacterium]|nr:hypothetical protein [Euzebyales bacterium]
MSVLTEAMWCARDAGDVDLLGRCAQLLASVRGGQTGLVHSLVGFTDLLRGNVEAGVSSMRSLVLAARDEGVDGTVERL